MIITTSNRIHFAFLFLALFAFLVSPKQVFAETSLVTKLVFASESEVVATATISGQLTVQLQNAAGSSEPAPDTMDVVFVSTSATGEFVNSSGDPVSKTMSRGTANKNFYYRDSTAGTHSMTVTATVRGTGLSFTSSQNITVGSGVAVNTGATSPASAPSAVSSGVVGGAGSLSSGETKLFSVNIGKDRTVTTQSLTKFNATLSPKSYEQNASVEWSFGDGSSSRGLASNHIYALPGTYVANVKVSVANEFAESKVLVNVINQDMAIIDAKEGYEGYVKIRNSSGIDLRLGNYGLSSGGQLFSFPENFIVLADTVVAIPARVSGLLSFPKGELVLRGPDGTSLATWQPKLASELPDRALVVGEANVPDTTIARLASGLDQIRSGLVAMRPVPLSPVDTKLVKDPVPESASTTRAPVIVEIQRKSSWITRLITLPRRLIASVIGAT